MVGKGKKTEINMIINDNWPLYIMNTYSMSITMAIGY